MNNLQVADQDQYQSNYCNIQLLGHVAHVKLNRPEKRNAMNWDFWRDLPRIIETLIEIPVRDVLFYHQLAPYFQPVWI